MRKLLFFSLLALAVAACKEDPTIVGEWQKTCEIVGRSLGEGHSQMDTTYFEDGTIYSFNEDHSLYVSDGHGYVLDNCQWRIVGDTLLMYMVLGDDGAQIQPGVMLVEHLAEEDMHWRNLVLGDHRVYLRRR